MTVGTGELDGNLACQPALDVESGIVQHRLACRRVGEQVAHRRGDFGTGRRRRLGASAVLRRPARCHPAGPHQLAISGRSNAKSEEPTSELQSLMRNSYAVSCLKTTKKQQPQIISAYSIV